MAQINLLPWREEFRQEKKKQFVTHIIGVIILAVIVSYLWVSSVNGQIENQRERNNILQSEIDKLAKQVKEIEELKKKRKELLDRMRVIQDLEGKRSIIVHYFDEFARSVPDGVYVKSLKRVNDVLTIEGVSESNNRISTFMRNLNGSEWFSDPNLKSVVASPELGDQSGVFSMELMMVLPEDSEDKNG